MGERFENILVIGDGGWGTALAVLLAEKGCRVYQWSAFPEYAKEVQRTRLNKKFLPGVKLPRKMRISGLVEDIPRDIGLIVSAVPTLYLRSSLNKLAVALNGGAPVVSGTKGIENSTLLRASQIIHETLGARRSIAVISGPSHAEEVARHLPTSVALGGKNPGLLRALQRLFSTNHFRVYTNSDITGVELGGALKNVIAIAGGMSDGLGYGDNSKSALLTRGLVEIARLGVKMGGRRQTFFGLAGLGDLMTTCFSRHSRNRAVGESIGRGKRLDKILSNSEMVPEGVWTVRSVVDLARKYRVEMPITEQVYKVLFEGLKPEEGVRRLMTRKFKSESG